MENKVRKSNISEFSCTNNTRLFRQWWNMMKRCYSTYSDSYNRYGAVGISVYSDWHVFENYCKWAKENGYIENVLLSGRNKLTLDRIDVNGNYEPSNCRWITNTEQMHNKRIDPRNKSGHTGVYWDKEYKTWNASITVNSKGKALGRFKTIKEAIDARKKAEALYWNK